MMLRSLCLALLASQVMGSSVIRGGSSLKADSKVGSRLLSKARSLNQQDDFTWVAGYEIKFDKCHSLIQVYGEEGNQADEDGGFTYTENLVTFSICPENSCRSGSRGCSGGGKYVVGMRDFVDAYTESKLEAQEYECEQIRENCYCDGSNTDDEQCENSCYTAQGRTDCIENDGTGADEEYDIQEFLECAEIENENNNNNNNNNGNYQVYYVGPYCSSDGSKIHLGTFIDQGCTYLADSGTFESLNYYGKSLPYSSSSESLVEHDCISCKEPEDQDQQNQDDSQDEDQVIALCEEMYEASGKCETNLKSDNQYFYKDTRACEYIHNVLPKLEKASLSVSNGGADTSVVLAWIFGISTLCLVVYAVYLYQKINRSKLNLTASDGQVS